MVKKDEDSINRPDESAPIEMDLRLSGPLDLRLAMVDRREFSLSPDAPNSIAVGEQTRYRELIEEFSQHINLPDLKLSMIEQNCCSITIDDEESALIVTIELRSGGKILIFTAIELYPEGVSQEVEARLETVNAAQQKDYYLMASKHTVFLCLPLPLSLTSVQLADRVADFYEESLKWRSQNKKIGFDPGSSSPGFFPSKGLKV